MKHSKWIAAVATAGGLLAVSSAHAIAPAAAVGLGAIAGAMAGSAAAHASQPSVTLVQPAPVAVVPGTPTTVMGAGPVVVQETVTTPVTNYTWQQGHYEVQNGVATYVPGQWVGHSVPIYSN